MEADWTKKQRTARHGSESSGGSQRAAVKALEAKEEMAKKAKYPTNE
jgi:hypothetical protein